MCFISLIYINGPMLRRKSSAGKYLCCSCGSSHTLASHVDKVFSVCGLPLKQTRAGLYSLECHECGDVRGGLRKYQLQHKKGKKGALPLPGSKHESYMMLDSPESMRGLPKLPTVVESEPSTPIAALAAPATASG